MSQRIIFVDFDRTLFRTDFLFPALWEAAGELYPGADVARAKEEMGQWYQVIVGDYKHYLFPEHFSHVTGEAFEEAAPLLLKRLSSHNFIYPDASAVNTWPDMGYEVRILTFGGEAFQKFKLSLAPDFTQPRDIILEPKGEFLARNYPDVTGYMIDDKRNPGLPPNIGEVWLNRQGQRAEDAIITISSLEQVQEFL